MTLTARPHCCDRIWVHLFSLHFTESQCGAPSNSVRGTESQSAYVPLLIPCPHPCKLRRSPHVHRVSRSSTLLSVSFLIQHCRFWNEKRGTRSPCSRSDHERKRSGMVWHEPKPPRDDGWSKSVMRGKNSIHRLGCGRSRRVSIPTCEESRPCPCESVRRLCVFWILMSGFPPVFAACDEQLRAG